MANTLKPLAQASLNVTATVVYTVPTATTAVIKNISFCNTTASSTAIDLFLVASGSSATVSNQMIDAMGLLGNEFVFVAPDAYLTAGYSIVISSTVGSVVGCTIFGVEIT